MDGLILLREARAAGLTVTVEGNQLRIRGPRRADAIARQLLAHKAVVLDALRSAAAWTIGPNDLPPDWHFAWDERAAIMEYDGGLPRERAEAEALKYILEEMRQAGIPLGGNTCV